MKYLPISLDPSMAWMARRLLDDMSTLSGCPYQRIAASVLLQAIKDCASPQQRTKPDTYVGSHRRYTAYVDDGTKDGSDADSARKFLSERSPALHFWTSLLGMKPGDINALYKSRIRQVPLIP